ncbi:hypothetical protein [Streptosporangium subroseum]|uniref:hypothetical protein n=1 Tax=Streptosporangium subroseum TaxID=106412 RepID=UPI003089D66B|nr:hypothetical protein OHB15_07775 [Streptosporangium subroseum]
MQPMPTKAVVMARINGALLGTPLAEARVLNPFASIAEGNISGFSAPSTQAAPSVPEPISDSKNFGMVKTTEKAGILISAKSIKFLKETDDWSQMTSDRFDELKVAGKKGYVVTGIELMGFKAGMCTMFTCAAIGFLAKNSELLGAGSVVELFKYVDGMSGHAFAVVDRALGGTANDVATWGAACYVIDPWYARHRLTQPGSNPVKDIDGTQGSPFYEPGYIAFLSAAKSRISQVAFTQAQLRQMGHV